jgi:hypothetical protein
MESNPSNHPASQQTHALEGEKPYDSKERHKNMF